ncbi:MBL fold metallo-hydrolase [Tunicatimonas pelagia]|uniref:MBL fold metallo-hydrolase n=1 Tax=Tunicatimonas pelagia TaxID=931531 RepID=UPI002665EC77|nr:rhodanese-like domain-containing protein [Tunicatimonas pelagia]WKN42121.1 rhodanese-like domain-containing protein [Tunicatimonas pelagia]
MEVKQFYDQALAHASYIIVSDQAAALVDPGRDPQPYLDFAQEHKATIVAVFETHPHADFVSSHLEFYQKQGATIYINSKMGADYPHQTLDDGEQVQIGRVSIQALFTPGHSPDHNTYLLLDETGKPHSVYTGDSLFVGDVGRPDLREAAGHLRSKREELAQQMYDTVNTVFRPMEDNVIVYPAHGAGSLCGKNMGPEMFSTIGQEKQQNWAFKIDDKNRFVEALLADQPFVPQYFPYAVEVNREGATSFKESLAKIPLLTPDSSLAADAPVVDVRSQEKFKRGHLPEAINIQEEGKFETWLGTLISPETPFYLVVDNEEQLERTLRRAAKIGYEAYVKGVIIAEELLPQTSPALDVAHFKAHPEEYTIVDIRNTSEVAGNTIFPQATSIPLPELSNRVNEIDTSQPIVVHCAGGYRSAAGASILEAKFPDAKIYDLSEAVKEF